jgi:hypothetical protein
MLKKSLIFSGLALILAMLLVFAGCEGPTGPQGLGGLPGGQGGAGLPGDNGLPGDDGFTGGLVVDPAGTEVSDTFLEAAFESIGDGTTVILGPSVTEVYGTVPAGKTLRVVGDLALGVVVTDGEELILESGSSLVIHTGAVLNATVVSGIAGSLAGTGSISGAGSLLLPVKTTSNNTAVFLTYTDVSFAGRKVGSVLTSSSTAAAIGASNLADAFQTVSALTVENLTGLTSTGIPAGKTLTLTGAGNTMAGFTSASGTGTLIVDGTLDTSAGIDFSLGGTLTVNGTLVTSGSGVTITGGGNITIGSDGILTLADAGDDATGITNNGSISTVATAGLTQKHLLTLLGTGTVELNGVGTTAVDTAQLTLTQNVTIGTTGKLIAPVVASAPFSGGKTITILGNGILDFGVTEDVTSIGATVVNTGTNEDSVTTSTTSPVALSTIMGIEGNISSDGVIALTGPLTIPANVNLTSDSAFTDGAYAVTIEGDVLLSGVATSDGDITVAADGTLTFSGAAAPTGDITVEADGTLTFSGTVAPTGDITVKADGVFIVSDDAVPEGDITVEAGGLLQITAGSLTIAAEKTLDNNNNVSIANGASLILTGATGGDGAMLTGTGSVAFGNASIIGGTDGWQADAASTTVVFSAAAANAPRITGTGSNPVLKAVDAGTGAITVGPANATLTLATVEVNVAGGGSIVIAKPEADNNIVKFAAADNATIKGLLAGTGDQDVTSSSIANATIDVGTNGVGSSGTGGDHDAVLKGKNTAADATITVAHNGGGDAVINKNVLIGADA